MTEELFPGDARAIPDASRGSAVLWATDEADLPPEVRETMRGPVVHAAGYAAFAEAAAEAGEDPHVLAADLPALLDLLGRRPDLVDAPAVADAAAVFLGNVLVTLRPGSSWTRTPEREVGGEAGSVVVDALLQRLVTDPEARAMLLDTVPGWVSEDAHQRHLQELTRQAMEGGPPPEPPRPYRRRAHGPVFRDDEGRAYGERWDDGPPDDAYSRLTHPERFAPLQAVADDLLAFLRTEYAVAVQDGRVDGTGTVRLDPAAGAPLELEYTDLPGVFVRAGAAVFAPIPHCGCDACDETWQAGADDLEQTVLGIVGGGLTELAVDGGWVTGLRTESGASGGSGGSADRGLGATPPDDGRWPAWPLRPVRNLHESG